MSSKYIPEAETWLSRECIEAQLIALNDDGIEAVEKWSCLLIDKAIHEQDVDSFRLRSQVEQGVAIQPHKSDPGVEAEYEFVDHES